MSLGFVTLNSCPPGLFLFEGMVGFKSEYSTVTAAGYIQCDAYVVESGEYFAGGAKSTEERGALMVAPIHLAPPVILAGGIS
jgi:hypothetical protein